MKIELNPAKWFSGKAGAAAAPPVAAAVPFDYGAAPTVTTTVMKLDSPANAVESVMSTAAVTPAASKNVFVNILQHVEKFFGVALSDIIIYTPAAENLAAVLFPQYASLIKVAGDKVVQVATLLKTTVLTIQQKYSDATPGDATNAAKLSDALAIAAGPAITLLGDAGITADTTTISNAIAATVAILKLSPAPVTTATTAVA